MTEKFTMNETQRAMSTSRLINGSPDLVYELFTTNKVDLWYGPKGCYIKTSKMEVKEGGAWNYTMYLPNGRTFDAFHNYTELVQNKRIVFESAQIPEAPEDQWFTTEIDLIPQDDGTEVKITMSYRSEEMFDQAKKSGAIRGYVSTLDKLAEHITSK